MKITLIITIGLMFTFSAFGQNRGGQQKNISQIQNFSFNQGINMGGGGPNSRGSNPVVLNNVSRGNSNLSIQSYQTLNNVSDNNVNFIANDDNQVNFNSNPRQANSNRNQGHTNKLRNVVTPKQMNQKRNYINDNNNEQMIQIAVVVEQKQAKERKQIELTNISLPSPKSIDMPKIEMTILPSINKAEKISSFELKKHKTGIYIQPKFLKKKVFNPTKAWFKRNFKSKRGKRNKTRKLSCCF